MFRTQRSLFLVISIIFLASNIYSASFGTFPYEIEKQSSDLELEYSIGFINPSSDPVRVTLSSDSSDEYNLTFSETEFQIPSGTTDNPSGSGWYHIGGGEYAKIYEKSFHVEVSKYREDNSLRFPVTIEAAATEENDGERSQSRLVQVRNYNYRAEIDPNLRPEERANQESDSSWRDNFWQEENPSSEEDFNLSQNKSSNQSQTTEETIQKQKNKTTSSNHSESSSKSSLANKTTLILITGIIISMGYILMEV